jgi:hypothetical protein
MCLNLICIFQKLLELEDAGEDERKDLHGKIESLESIVRMLELKSKNSSDHGTVPVSCFHLLFGSFENIGVLLFILLCSYRVNSNMQFEKCQFDWKP